MKGKGNKAEKWWFFLKICIFFEKTGNLPKFFESKGGAADRFGRFWPKFEKIMKKSIFFYVGKRDESKGGAAEVKFWWKKEGHF